MPALNFNKVSIELLGHDTVRIKSHGKVIYIDPYILDPEPDKADLVLITHEHFDHCNPEKIAKIQNEATQFIIPGSCISKIKGDVKIASAGSEISVEGVFVTAIPAYNLNKFRSEGILFHPKGIGLGYIVELEGFVKIFHSGDSDNIPEFESLRSENIDVAFLPVSGTYVMTAEEAAKAVKAIKPKIAVPMHYGIVAGSKEDARKFKELVGEETRVEILV